MLSDGHVGDEHREMHIAPPAHKPIKTPGLENGTGGPRQAPKPKKMPIEEAAKLRETNYREYKRLLEAGQIETDEF
jgi:hypothetical protein